MKAKNNKPELLADFKHYTKDAPALIRLAWDALLKDTPKKRGDLLKLTRQTYGRHKRSERVDVYLAIIGQSIPLVDIETGFVNSTATGLAYATNTMTRSAIQDQPAITRCTRALHDLAEMSLLTIEGGDCNPDTGERNPLLISYTPEMWQLLGISPRELARKRFDKQARRLADAGIIEHNGQRYSLAEFDAAARQLKAMLYNRLCEKVKAYKTQARAKRKAANNARKAAYTAQRREAYAKAKAERRKAMRYAEQAEHGNQPQGELELFDAFTVWDNWTPPPDTLLN